MKKLGYLDSCFDWIKLYHFTMSNWNKNLIAYTFLKPDDKTMECNIVIVTDAYSKRIDNLEIKLVIQWNFLITFNAIIQQLEEADSKGELSTFILFIPK